MQKPVLAILAALLLGTAACAPLPLAFGPRAYHATHIDSGAAFGVTVGMDRQAARQILLRNRQFHFIGTEPCRDYPKSGEMCDGAIETDIYRVDGVLMTGRIGVNVTKGRVVRIEWSSSRDELL